MIPSSNLDFDSDANIFKSDSSILLIDTDKEIVFQDGNPLKLCATKHLLAFFQPH